MQFQYRNRRENVFDHYYSKERQSLVGIAMTFKLDCLEAEDVVQEIFINLWQKKDIEKFTSEQALDNFLFIMLRNRCINIVNGKKVEKKRLSQYALVKSAYTENYQLEIFDLRTKLNAAISKLPPKRKEIFLLSYLFGKSRRFIARSMSIAEESVKAQMQIALENLRKELRSEKTEIKLSGISHSEIVCQKNESIDLSHPLIKP